MALPYTLYSLKKVSEGHSLASKEPSDLNRALTALRTALNWNQAKLARVAGVQPNVISDFERGQRNFDRGDLEKIAGLMGLPPEAADWAVNFVRPVRLVAQAPGHPGSAAEAGLAHVERLAVRSGDLSAQFTRSLLSFLAFEGRALEARQRAPVLWQRMKGRAPAQRRALVEDTPEFRSWALCELLCKESIKAAADNADRARELAELALFVADLVGGEASWCWRLEGYAWAHVGNARRVRSDLPGAEEAFDRARKLWEAGAPGDPGLLDEAQVLSLEASLRIDQCRLAEAAALLNRALEADRGTLRLSLLIKRARLLEWAGDYEDALATLEQMAPLIFAQEDTRLLIMLQHNSAWNLTHLGRYLEAEALIPKIRALTLQLNNDLDALRLRWLEGRIASGFGRTEEALAAFSQLRVEFARREIAYDAALVTLELALIKLGRGRTQEVKTLARQMTPIFQAQGVHREALAALRLFCEAAERELATVELARRIVDYLYRAQHNPQLRFESADL
jgi:transcriptional regulator with XRE-family HTH domain